MSSLFFEIFSAWQQACDKDPPNKSGGQQKKKTSNLQLIPNAQFFNDQRIPNF